MKKILLLGSGELGKEFVIAAKRAGQYVVACDRYAGAPAMQVADECEVFPVCDDQIYPMGVSQPPKLFLQIINAFDSHNIANG